MVSICLCSPFDGKFHSQSSDKIFARFGNDEKDRIDKISHSDSALLSIGGLFSLCRLTDIYLKDKQTLTIVRDWKDKPSFENPSLGSFNISHSGELSCAALSLTQNVGIDIEKIDESRNISGISKRFFSTYEIEQICKSEDTARSFFELWTAKEAYSKYSGCGISSIADFDILKLCEKKEAFILKFAVKYNNCDYILSVCTATPCGFEIINDNGEIDVYEIP